MAKRKKRTKSQKLTTPSGKPSAYAYKRYGNKRGKFPIYNSRTARSALKLRGHAKTKAERRSIINRAAKYAPAAAKKARAADRKAGKI